MVRSGLIALLLVLMLAAVSVLFPSQRAAAQTETPAPTVTPTPSDLHRVTLSSGAELVIERRITYGEIAVVVVVGLLLVGFAIYATVHLIRLWIY